MALSLGLFLLAYACLLAIARSAPDRHWWAVRYRVSLSCWPDHWVSLGASVQWLAFDYARFHGLALDLHLPWLHLSLMTRDRSVKRP